jgi:hypothetical protein
MNHDTEKKIKDIIQAEVSAGLLSELKLAKPWIGNRNYHNQDFVELFAAVSFASCYEEYPAAGHMPFVEWIMDQYAGFTHAETGDALIDAMEEALELLKQKRMEEEQDQADTE